MTKAKGRVAREKGLPEIQGQELEREDRWSAPADVLQEEYPIVFDDDNRLMVRWLGMARSSRSSAWCNRRG